MGAFERRCASVQSPIDRLVASMGDAGVVRTSAADSDTLFSNSELDAVHSKFAQVVSGGDGEMSLAQFKSMYVSLFRHTAEESMEDLEDNHMVLGAHSASASSLPC